MNRMMGWMLLLVLAGGGVACASSGSGSGSTYREDLGRILADPLMETRTRIWGLHQIPLYREEINTQRLSFGSSSRSSTRWG